MIPQYSQYFQCSQCSHCSQLFSLLSELTKAKQAALSSFDELAQLRTNLNETMASGGSTKGLKSSGGSTSTTHNCGVRGRMGGDDERDRLENTEASEFVSGLYESYPQRGTSLESTTDILQGSVVIAEADALLTEFRDSFFQPQGTQASQSQSMGVSMLSQSMFDTRLKPINETIGRYDDDAPRRDRSMVNANYSTNTISNNRTDRADRVSPSEGGGDSLDDMEMFAFLEKYSDRLVEMVSNKVIEKTKTGSEKPK